MVEITDRESLEAWLETRRAENSILVAARSALRAFPLAAREIGIDAEEGRAGIVLPVLRALAVANFASRWPSLAGRVRKAAEAADHAASDAVRTAAPFVTAAAAAQYAARVVAASDAGPPISHAASYAAASAAANVRELHLSFGAIFAINFITF